VLGILNTTPFCFQSRVKQILITYFSVNITFLNSNFLTNILGYIMGEATVLIIFGYIIGEATVLSIFHEHELL
jgi:hypothetical protein